METIEYKPGTEGFSEYIKAILPTEDCRSQCKTADGISEYYQTLRAEELIPQHHNPDTKKLERIVEQLRENNGLINQYATEIINDAAIYDNGEMEDHINSLGMKCFFFKELYRNNKFWLNEAENQLEATPSLELMEKLEDEGLSGYILDIYEPTKFKHIPEAKINPRDLSKLREYGLITDTVNCSSREEGSAISGYSKFFIEDEKGEPYVKLTSKGDRVGLALEWKRENKE
ncbi:MAG: hypothetical protein KAT28_02170 [Candidatus Aenigmarchaeota archaeon]|nr:hypothetical protein [Candidatus Aenigmarchaeota archaeon]